MQRLEVSSVVRLIYRSLGVKGLNIHQQSGSYSTWQTVVKEPRTDGGPRPTAEKVLYPIDGISVSTSLTKVLASKL